MEYLTVRETSEKWGMSIRMVNYYLNTGRIEGAVRKKSEWLIPYTAKSPLDIRKKALNAALEESKLRQEYATQISDFINDKITQITE